MTGQPLPTVPDVCELSLDDLLSQTFKLADFGSGTVSSLLESPHLTLLYQPIEPTNTSRHSFNLWRSVPPR